ncbi:lipopolysaccharide biosynthesis protein [Plantactinospora sp. KBS50]|uniref:lipopolysaccharide biosynthesis protein n=1 Tax=Plantactinospora sp. KBS50 TaxID=2024580 RepID=UPI000BAAE827|nr:hypothetical protein [Plantactinospora sp. KBS50]ASW53863.1 hypothetical protein CIK06_06165 [Plantactinospora sp. KBS50]
MLALVAVGGTRLVHGSLTSHATDRTSYGVVGVMLAASTIASLLLPGGLSSSTAKFVAYHRGAGDVAGAWAVHRFLGRLGLGASVALGVLTAVVLQRIYQLGTVDTVSLAILTATYSLYTLDKSAMYGHGLVSQYAKIELATSVVAIISTVVVILTRQAMFLLPLCIGYGTFILLCRRQLHAWRQRDRAGVSAGFDRREVIGFTVLGSIGTLASAGFLQGTQLLAGHFAAPSQVAYVVAAVALIAPLYFLPRAMALAMFPAMAGARGAGDRKAVRTQVDVSTRGLALTMTPMLLAGMIGAPLVLGVFGGAGYAGGAGVLRLMLCASFFGILQIPSVNALASGPPAQARIPVLSAVVGCLIGLCVVAVVARPLGAAGVGLGYLVGTAVTATIPILVTWRLHRLAWASTLARCTGLLTAGALLVQIDALQTWSWTAAAVTAGALAGTLALVGGDLHRLLRFARSSQTRRFPSDSMATESLR